MTPGKIGIGIITYKRVHFFKHCYNSIPWDRVDVAVVVNDGPEYDLEQENVKLNDKTTWIQHETNMKLSKTKNDAIEFLYDQDCEHIFIIEDDTLIEDPEVFEKYINAAKISGIKHLNYGPGSPFNREQDPNVIYDLHNRHLAKQDSKPAPRMIVEYENDVKIAEHITADIHANGSAVVAVLPYEIAEQKGVEVTVEARSEGFPLMVKIEPEKG